MPDPGITFTSFTLFDFSPTFQLEEGQPGRPERCTKGHSWNFGLHFVGVRLDLSTLGLTDGPEEFCLLCLRDMCRAHLGRVKNA